MADPHEFPKLRIFTELYGFCLDNDGNDDNDWFCLWLKILQKKDLN